NYGQTQAIAAGFDNADGQKIIIMDADLQNDPADIPKLLHKLEEGYDLVSGWRINRQDNLLLKKIPSFLANKLSLRVSKVKIHDLGCTLKAYRRELLENIEFYGEIHRFLPFCAAMQGAKIAEIPVKHYKRKFGKSKYGIWRGFRIILDLFPLIFAWKFITKPIYFFGGIGLFLIGLSAITAFFIIIRKLFWAGVWVSPLLFLFVILLSIGVQFILMGIMMEFIIRLYQGSCGQKRYKIKKILKK
ncbi:MAG: glycosyltransferase, partial [Candidatus Omnitrophica bacterium]|nr:glycosyltransferase [Candidatus Omnitrophota bacterium]